MPAEFDEQLQRRLRAFQEHHGLTTDGVAGTQTWTRLMATGPAAAPAASSSPTQQIVIPLSDYPQLHAAAAAESLDRWLAELGIGDQQAHADDEEAPS